ncbi:endonuclease/exonuclease/phosphatase family protein [Cytobacillus sp. S13-E01]|uniref:endonuclease/exonuclease/phosphatase family protein n=1 Tax=Cytobacillus sp. S13-E01 TaxID=3031326 RepID=UPI0023D81A12|nr:endonuclease/exonuclease/phosphatase family protein [Cytobacillus sp. S13-E01]MDF0725640.1 endonuclease/exonuclease/phosphatase family protein [Cytobacillus sp. S13-E01]
MSELKVVTFNIHHGKGIDKKMDLNRVALLLRESGAQIIGLNEVDFNFGKRSNYQDQAGFLAKQLNMTAVHGPTLIKGNNDLNQNTRKFGNAILSNVEYSNHKNHHLYAIPFFSEGRGLLELTIRIDEIDLSVFVTHLSLNPFLQTMQIKEILQIIKKKKYAILMGDFNLRPKSKGYNLIVTELNDTASPEIGETYPAQKPRHKLDFIFTSRSMTVLHSEVIKNNPVVSDHLPLAATLKFE